MEVLLESSKSFIHATVCSFCEKELVKKVSATSEKDEVMIKMISSSYDISDKRHIEPIIEFLQG